MSLVKEIVDAKCKEICECGSEYKEGTNQCCYFCDEKESCGNPCAKSPYDCNNTNHIVTGD